MVTQELHGRAERAGLDRLCLKHDRTLGEWWLWAEHAGRMACIDATSMFSPDGKPNDMVLDVLTRAMVQKLKEPTSPPQAPE